MRRALGSQRWQERWRLSSLELDPNTDQFRHLPADGVSLPEEKSGAQASGGEEGACVEREYDCRGNVVVEKDWEGKGIDYGR